MAEYALYLGAFVQPAVRKFKLPIQGRFLHSIGHTTLNCRFPGEGNAVIRTIFIVFPRLTTRVIFGIEFLTSTQIWSKHRHRLKDIETVNPAKIPPRPLIRSVRGTEMASVECWIDGIPLHSLPDTGADLNLISADFAASIIRKRQEQAAQQINRFETTTIEFADRSTVATQGTVLLTISFHEPSKCLDSTYELAASSHAGASQPERSRVPSNSRLIETFHIVEGLEPNVILCETLLATVDAFNQHRQNFVSSIRDTVDCVAVGKEKKGKERKQTVQVRPLEDTAARLTDDYNNASDSYQKALDKIEDQLLGGEIEEGDVPTLQAHAYQAFLDWARQNKARFDRFRPNFLEQKFPAGIEEPTDQAQQP